MKQYSADLRERLLGAIDAGLPQVEAAHLFGVSVSSIKRWRTQQRQTGSLAPRRRTGRHRRVQPEQETALLAQVVAILERNTALQRTLLRVVNPNDLKVEVVPSPITLKRYLLYAVRYLILNCCRA